MSQKQIDVIKYVSSISGLVGIVATALWFIFGLGYTTKANTQDIAAMKPKVELLEKEQYADAEWKRDVTDKLQRLIDIHTVNSEHLSLGKIRKTHIRPMGDSTLMKNQRKFNIQ